MRDIRGDVAVEHDDRMVCDGAQEQVFRFEAIAGKQQRDQKGMHFLQRSEPTVQELADRTPEQGRLVTRKTDECRRHAGPREAIAQRTRLRPLARAVDAFQIDQHEITVWATPPAPSRRRWRS